MQLVVVDLKCTFNKTKVIQASLQHMPFINMNSCSTDMIQKIIIIIQTPLQIRLIAKRRSKLLNKGNLNFIHVMLCLHFVTSLPVSRIEQL